MMLSICIATYNRADKLARTLAALREEGAGRGNVQILVGDNASTDGTPEVVLHHLGKGAPISYIRHERNIGPSANYLALVNQASGDYVWLLSDDDYLAHGCVAKLLDVLNSGTYGYVFINYLLRSEATGETMPSEFRATENGYVCGIADLFRKTQFANSFISSNVFRRDAWHGAFDPAYFATQWPQIYMACAICEKWPGYVIAEPLLMMGAKSVIDSRAEKAAEGKPTYYMDAHLDYLALARKLDVPGLDAQVREMNLPQIVYFKATTAGYRMRYLLATAWAMVRCKALRYSLRFWTVEMPLLFAPIDALKKSV